MKTKLYRIWTLKRPFSGVILKSPFIFKHDEAVKRCQLADDDFNQAAHFPELEEHYKEKEVYHLLKPRECSDDIKAFLTGRFEGRVFTHHLAKEGR